MATPNPQFVHLQTIEEQATIALRALEAAGAAYTLFAYSGTANLLGFERDQLLEARGLLRAAYAAASPALEVVETARKRLATRAPTIG